MQMHDLVLIFSFDLLVSHFFLEDNAKLIHKQRGKQNLNTHRGIIPRHLVFAWTLQQCELYAHLVHVTLSHTHTQLQKNMFLRTL